MFNLKGRSVLTMLDFTTKEIDFLLDLAANLKKAKYARNEKQSLKGKNIVLIFEKNSTRTRISFEVAALDQGAHVTYLGPSGNWTGYKESIKDTARVLGRVYDAIEYRGFYQTAAEQLAKYAGIPVWNGLTDRYHPTQLLADLLTMREHFNKPLSEVSICYLGDARNNVANSLMVGAAKFGMDIRTCAPADVAPDEQFVERCRQEGKKTGAKISIHTDPKQAVKGVDVIYTDVWVAMDETEDVWNKRVPILMDYQVTQELMDATGNPNTKFMHNLPAFHNKETTLGKKLIEKYGTRTTEVTEEVFESDASIVFDQSENRLHTIKAIMVATIGD